MDKFAVGAGGNWSIDATWSTTSGGSPDTTIPTADDDVWLDSNSGDVSINTSGLVCRSLQCDGNPDAGSGAYTGVLTHTANTLTLGNAAAGIGTVILTLVSGMNYTKSGGNSAAMTFVSGGSADKFITLGAQTLGDVTFDKSDGQWKFVDHFATTRTITLNTGLLNTNGQQVDCQNFVGSSASAKTLTLGASGWNLQGTGTVWTLNAASTINPGTSFLRFSDTSSTAITFAGGGKTYYNVWFDRGASTGIIAITGNNTFNELKDTGTAAHTLRPNAASTQTFTGSPGFVVNGSAGNLITLTSSNGVSNFTLSKASGVVSCNYLNIQHSIATGGAQWVAGLQSVNNQAVNIAGSGWQFFSASQPGTSFHPGKGMSNIARFYQSQKGYGFGTSLSLSDSVTLSDSIVKTPGLNKSDTVTLSDSNVKSIGLNPSDSVTLSDAFVKAIAMTKSDSVTLSDALVKTIAMAQADSITLSDQATKAISLLKSDSITLSDDIVKNIGLNKSDSITLIDAIAKSYGLPLSDSISLSDFVVKSIGLNPSDTITLSDLLQIAQQFILSLSDEILLTDDVNMTLIPPTPPPPSPGTGGGGGVTGGTYHDREHEEKREKERRRKILDEDRFIIEFLKTATNIINNQ